MDIDVPFIIRMIFGSIFVLFVPGFAWTYAFFQEKEVDWIERITLSFALSIALVPLTVFYLNTVFQVKITLINSSIAVLGITLAGVLIYFMRKRGTLEKIKSRVTPPLKVR